LPNFGSYFPLSQSVLLQSDSMLWTDHFPIKRLLEPSAALPSLGRSIGPKVMAQIKSEIIGVTLNLSSIR
jgi:hypothetical protein